MQADETGRAITLRVAAFAGYLLVTMGMTFPWVLHFATHTPDGGGESSMFLWNLWHFRRGLLQGSPLATDLLLVPYGANLTFHTYTLSRDILALPLLSIFPLIVAQNLLTLLSFGLAGLGVWLLVHELTGDARAAFVAGLIYTFAPFRFAHLGGHYHVASIEWIPFYALFALRFLRDGRRGDVSLAAVFALATSLTDYAAAVLVVVWSGLAVLWHLAATRAVGQTARRAGLLAVAALVVHLPLLVAARWALIQGAWVGRPVGLAMARQFSADLAAFVVPSFLHPLVGPWTVRIIRSFTVNLTEGTVYLGGVPLVLALVATLRFRRWPCHETLWILTFWAFIVLALGPELRWRGHVLGPLPYRWLGEIPVFREARIPSRFTVVAVLALAVLGGRVLAWLGERLRAPSRRAVYAGTALLILFEYLPAPLYLANWAVPRVYEVIAADAQPGAVLDLPFGINDSFAGLGGWNPRAMYFQTVTGRPLVGAHIARIPRHVFEGYARMPVIGRLAHLARGGTYSAADVAQDRQAVAGVIGQLGLGFIVVRDPTSSASAYVEQVFHGCLERLPDDGTARGYRVRRPCLINPG